MHDLFTDIQDGSLLMALLEELSGYKLVRVRLSNEQKNVFTEEEIYVYCAPVLRVSLMKPLKCSHQLYRFRSSSHRIFRLNNISKALAFLDDRHVSVFALIWLYFVQMSKIYIKDISEDMSYPPLR